MTEDGSSTPSQPEVSPTAPAPAAPEPAAEGRPSLWSRIRSRPVLSGGIATIVLGLIVFVLVWFQPQALLFDRVVDEDFPVVAEPSDPDDAGDAGDTATSTEPDADEASIDATNDSGEDGDAAAPDATEEPADEEVTDEADAAEPAEPAEPVALATGSFTSLNRYTVVGEATTYELEDGSRVLRLEDFESTNGPDLYVYLSAAGSTDGDEALDEDAVDLGVLSGNIGNQNYDIPDDVDLDHYDTVVIWCLRFTTAFGAADLTTG